MAPTVANGALCSSLALTHSALFVTRPHDLRGTLKRSQLTSISLLVPSRRSVRAWVAAGDAQGVPACATVAMLDKYGDVVELRQLYLGSSNMAATPGGNCTTPPPLSPTPPLVPPSPTPVGPSPAPVSPPPITPGGGGLPPANASNTIYTSIRMNIGGTPCSLWNGTGWQTSTTE